MNSVKKDRIIFFDLTAYVYSNDFGNEVFHNICLGSYSISINDLEEISVKSICNYLIQHKDDFFNTHSSINPTITLIEDKFFYRIKTTCIKYQDKDAIVYYFISNIKAI